MKIEIGRDPFIFSIQTRSKEAHSFLSDSEEVRKLLESDLRKILIQLENVFREYLSERRY